MVEEFATRGWIRFDHQQAVADWAARALVAAKAAVRDPRLAHWHVCAGTWFVGVDALANDESGRVGGSAPLTGAVMEFITAHLGALPLHPGQVSVIYPGYPQPREGESAAASRYRRRRAAAHVDGVKPVEPGRRRMVREPHAWILGLPLTETSPDAAPMVVWEGSHHVLRAAFADAMAGFAPDALDQVDLTDAYGGARARVFETCRRVSVFARPGEAYVLHRHALHGVAPWGRGASAGPDGRMIAYFRPLLPGGIGEWLAG